MTIGLNRTFQVQYVVSYEMCILFAPLSIAITGLIVPIYFIPLFFQFVRGDSALSTSLRILPLIVAGAMTNGALFQKADMYLPYSPSLESISLQGKSTFDNLHKHLCSTDLRVQCHHGAGSRYRRAGTLGSCPGETRDQGGFVHHGFHQLRSNGRSCSIYLHR